MSIFKLKHFLCGWGWLGTLPIEFINNEIFEIFKNPVEEYQIVEGIVFEFYFKRISLCLLQNFAINMYDLQLIKLLPCSQKYLKDFLFVYQYSLEIHLS